jgi:hypothetical protein
MEHKMTNLPNKPSHSDLVKLSFFLQKTQKNRHLHQTGARSVIGLETGEEIKHEYTI